MTQIYRSEDCGNSPKNIFVQELSIALALRDIDRVLEGISDDVCWEVVGRSPVVGKAAVAEKLSAGKSARVQAVTIHHVVTHGKAGAVDGTIQRKDGSSLRFCDVHEFRNAKGSSIRAITSYVIDSN